MATDADLRGLGFSMPQSLRLGRTPVFVDAMGVDWGSAYKIKATEYIVIVNSVHEGSGLTLPPFAGERGAMIGDAFTICNRANDAIRVYTSTVDGTITGGGKVHQGDFGFAVESLWVANFILVSAKEWIGFIA